MSTWTHPNLGATRTVATTPEREAELEADGWVRVDMPRKPKGQRRTKADTTRVQRAATDSGAADADSDE